MQFHSQVPGTSVKERQNVGAMYHFMACRTRCQGIRGSAIGGYDATLLFATLSVIEIVSLTRFDQDLRTFGFIPENLLQSHSHGHSPVQNLFHNYPIKAVIQQSGSLTPKRLPREKRENTTLPKCGQYCQ